MERIDKAIVRRLYCDYLSNIGDKARHTAEAKQEADEFEAYCLGAFGDSLKLRKGLYDRMMRCATEFEESGFIAGFSYAYQLVYQAIGSDPLNLRLDEKVPAPGTSAQKAKLGFSRPANAQPCTPAVQKDIVGPTISSRQIAELFCTTNWKVCNRIETKVVPRLGESSTPRFVKIDDKNSKGKPVYYYKLNKAACEKYIESIAPYKDRVNILYGISKMNEMMDSVFA